MALRTVEQRKKVLHIANKQNKRTGSSVGSSPPGASQVDKSGEMTSASGCFFMPENQPRVQEEADSSGVSIECRAVSCSKDGRSGKVLHTVAQTGMEAVNNHVEGGEELRESEEILMAMGAAGKRVFRINRRKSLARQKYGMQRKVTGVVSNRAPDPSSRGKQLAKDKKDGQNKKKSHKLREKRGMYGKRRRYGTFRRRRKRDEYDEDEEPTPIGIRERLIHAFRVRDAKEDSADTLGSVTKGTKGLKRVIKIILFLIKKLITLLLLPLIIVLVVIVVLIALIVGILMLIIYCSPLSIFFPLPDTGTDDIRIVLSRYYQDFNAKITSYEANGTTVTYQNTRDGVVTVNFKDTLMVYLTLYADGAPGFIMDDAGRANLKKVFDEMNYIDTGRTERQVKVGDSLGKVFVTAYCPCRECSGPHGHATASGNKAKEGRTVAVDAYDPIVPMGTKVVIDGHTYTVEDTGDLHKYGNEFDIFYEKHTDTEKWGRRKVEVFLADENGEAHSSGSSSDNGSDSGEPDEDHSGGSGSVSGGNTDSSEESSSVTVKSDGIIVHNLTWKDYIDAHPELNDDQKKMIKMLMEEETSYYGGGSDIGQNVVLLGMTKLGCHYSQARRFDEGYYDCSSFALRLYAEFGLELPGTAAEQGRFCVEHGMIINYEDLRPGDLIFYSYEKNDRYRNISHVAIYAGDGKMIHAANPRRGVVMDPIRTGSVVFYGRPYIG